LTLQIKQQETENRELKLTVQVDEARVQNKVREVIKKSAKNMRVPGFRPGKAPLHVIQRRIGEEALRTEAINSMLEDIFKEAIEQAEVTPYAPGVVDEMELEPLVLRITVPLIPKVDLGDYRQAQVDPPQVEAADEQVDEAMKAVQEKHALLELAGRPAAMGDVVIANIRAVQDGETVFEREAAELLLDPEKLFPGTLFVDNVVGMSAGEEKSFALPSPADETDVKTYTIAVQDVKARYLPPLNDELALEEGYETLLEMRIDVRRRLTEALQQRADAAYADQVYQKIRKGAVVTYPPVAIEQALDQMINNARENLKQQDWELEDYLKTQAKTIETLREELRPSAVEKLKENHIVAAFLRAERLAAEEAEVEQLIDERLGAMGEMDEEAAGQLREIYSSEKGRVAMLNDVLTAKFTERLRAIGRDEAPELPDPSEEEE